MQRNKCTRLIRDTKRKFYATLNLKNLKDQRKFWKTVRPIFNNKVIIDRVTSLVESDDIVTENKEIAEVMNDYFTNIASNLNLPKIPKQSSVTHAFPDDIHRIIHEYRSHPSVIAIQEKFSESDKFDFKNIDDDELERHIGKLNPRKAGPENDIPAVILKQFSGSYTDLLTMLYNKSQATGLFPDDLKSADVSPIFKKGAKCVKSNYRPISKLPNLSKVFERIMHNDISVFMSSKLSPLLSGFRANYSTQHALLCMIEKWHRELDKGNFVAAVLMDLSKAFDCINHELLIAKMHAYGFSHEALNFICSYLSNRFQRVVVEGESSSWKDLIIGVPRGSILGPLLFNIYINDLFFFIDDTKVSVCNYADDNTLYSAGKDPLSMMNQIHETMDVISSWYEGNGLQMNAGKCQLIVLKGSKKRDFTFNLRLGDEVLEEVPMVKLLGVNLDNKLSYKEHVDALCRKIGSKIAALKRISPFLSSDKNLAIANSFIASELNYCPLIWSFASRTSLNHLQSLQDRVEKLSPGCRHVDLHRRNCEFLLREVFKTKNDLNPSYMKDIFSFRNNYPYWTRNQIHMNRQRIFTSRHGLQTASYIGAELWEALPDAVRDSDSLSSFSSQLQKLDSLNCRCRLCAQFVPNLGFVT